MLYDKKFINANLGCNSISKIGIEIATVLNLDYPQLYTGHCFRRTSATALANQGGSILQLKNLGGWKSTSVAERYVADSCLGKRTIAEKLKTAISSPPKKKKKVPAINDENIDINLPKGNFILNIGSINKFVVNNK